MPLVTVEGVRIAAYGLTVERNAMGFLQGVSFQVGRGDFPFDVFGIHETLSLNIVDDDSALSGLFRLVQKHYAPKHYGYRFVYVAPLVAAHPQAVLKSLDERVGPKAAEPSKPPDDKIEPLAG